MVDLVERRRGNRDYLRTGRPREDEGAQPADISPSTVATTAPVTSKPATSGLLTPGTCSSIPTANSGISTSRPKRDCRLVLPVPAAATTPNFSPDGNFLSYVRDHNLYSFRLRDTVLPVRLTDSQAEHLLNGEVDWVYEEELEVRSNYFWSPDSRKIAYLQTNESAGAGISQSKTGFPTTPRSSASATPNPAIPNPAVRVGVVNATGGKTRWINIPLDERQRLRSALRLAQQQNSLDRNSETRPQNAHVIFRRPRDRRN